MRDWIWQRVPQIRDYLQNQGVAIEQPIGRGGMADVAKAAVHNMTRAVKICRQPIEDAEHIRDEQERLEKYLKYSLDHPAIVRLVGYHIVPVEDGNQRKRYLCTIWELARTSLDKLAGSLALDELFDRLASVAEALDFLHGRGFVHRDVKPQNIFCFDDPPQARLGDFGFARPVGQSSASGSIVGTPGFVAPEVLLSGKAKPASDLFSLAATYLWMRFGRLPDELGQWNSDGTWVPNDEQSAELQAVAWALHWDPKRRFAGGAVQWLGSVRAALSGNVVTAPTIACGPPQAQPASWPARLQALQAYARAEQACVLDRIRRFRSPQLEHVTDPADLLAVLDGMHVPFNVLVRVRLPRDDREAFQQETERLRHAPPAAPDRLAKEERQFVRPFDEQFDQWRRSWKPQSRPLVVLGDPGYGKTWLAGLVSLRLLHGIVNSSQVEPPQDWIPLRATCRELAAALKKQSNLAEAVADVVAGRLRQWNAAQQDQAAALRDLVLWGFSQQRIFLVADGWDEQRAADRLRLRESLAAWSGPLLLTSRVIGRPAENDLRGADEPWMLVPLDAPQGVRCLIRGWFGPEQQQKAQQLITALERRPQLSQLVRVPLLAVLVCHLYQKGKLPPVPEQRTRMLEQCLKDLLASGCREAKKKGPRVATEPGRDIAGDLLRVVAGLAEKTFTGERWVVAKARLKSELSRLPPELRYLGDNYDLYQALTDRFGLLTECGEERLEIVHHSFAEFLYALGVVERFGRDAETFAENRAEFKRWLREDRAVQRRLQDPQWWEVWFHVAALLPNPRPLLDILCSEERDDVFRHRLALAGYVLAGIDPSLRQKNSDLVDQITTLVFVLWWRHRESGTSEVAAHMEEALPSLAEANGRLLKAPRRQLNGRPLRTCLAELLRDRDSEVRSSAAYAVGRLGPAAATPEFLARLAELLRDPDDAARWSAAQAVGKVGPAAATPEFLARLAELLRDPDDNVRESAAWAVRELGPAAATREILEGLAELLRDSDFRVRRSAAQAVGSFGPAAATREILEGLAELLRDSDFLLRLSAAQAVGSFGPAAATPEFLERLFQLLRDPKREIRATAAWAAGELRPAVPTPVILETLTELLGDPDESVREGPAWAVRKLGPAAATPEILERLVELLRDSDFLLRLSAAKAVGSFGPAAATPEFLARLAELLGDPDESVREDAANAVGKLGPAAATPEILAALAELLRDRDEDVRESAAEPLGRLMRQGLRFFPGPDGWIARRLEELGN